MLTLLSLLATAGVTLAQHGNHGSPFPNTTYSDAYSDDPVTVQGSNSFQLSPPHYPSPWGTGQGGWEAAYEKARAFVSQLTLEEKVNLTTGTGWEMERCVGQTGSIPRLGFRSSCSQDSPVGVRDTDLNTVFPAGVNVAATWDRGLAYARGQAMGAEHRDKGVDMQLGPVAGPLGRTPEGGRNWEGFSPDPYLTGELFAQSIEGIQSSGVMACAKHFIGYEQDHFRLVAEAQGYGFTNVTESVTSNIDDKTMHESYLWPFANAVRSGVAAVMCSYNQINGSYACQNSKALGLLKGELGFQGLVVSDWDGHQGGVSGALAGLDMSMPGDIHFDMKTSYWGSNLTVAVLNGTVPQWRVDDMAVRIMAAYYSVGRENNTVDINFSSWTLDTYGYEYFGTSQGSPNTVVNSHVDVRADHAAIVRQIGSASTVLLKNTNNVLPLTGEEKLTAVIGEDAGSNPLGPNGCTDRGCDNGTLGMAWGSGSANFPYLVTPNTAIQNVVVGNNQAYESITDNYAFDEIAALASRASVAIVFANSDSGEGYIEVDQNFGDRNNLTSWQGADAMIKNVSSVCNNTISVVHSTGPVLLGDYKSNPNITAISWAGVPGQESGNSIADVSYGVVNPGAKLPFTLAAAREDYGTDILYTPNAGIPQVDFKEGVFIDYRGFDHHDIEPVYELGFGLSYTNFSYSNLQIAKTQAGNYTATTGYTPAAPTYGTVDNDTASYVFPANQTRVRGFIYPWLNSTNLTASADDPHYDLPGFVPEGAQDGSPQPLNPAGGGPGGNPELFDVLYQVTATITNTGKVAGEEIPQSYVSLGGPYDPPVQSRGFERLSIQPNSSTTFTADIMRRDISNWDTVSQNWVISNYTKMVYVGSSSRNSLLNATSPL